MTTNFEHISSGHCENGVIVSLLNFHNIKLSEPMVFGIGSGLFFAYMPFVKVNGLPATSFRPIPGMIFSRAAKRLGIKMKKQRFPGHPAKAMNELDKALDKGLPVGVQAGVYHLSYFPPAYRFHFNSHNLTVYGKENGIYKISDPVMEYPTELSYKELMKVRYAKGAFAPKGRMYYPVELPEKMDLEAAIKKGIKQTIKYMLEIPVPLFGVKGMRYLAKRIRKWPDKLGAKRAAAYLAMVVRMLEEIGTGGAGFRFIYAAFLQEAEEVTGNAAFNDYSKRMTEIGDMWRNFASKAAQTCKGRSKSDAAYDEVSNLLLEIADKEEQLFTDLKKVL